MCPTKKLKKQTYYDTKNSFQIQILPFDLESPFCRNTESYAKKVSVKIGFSIFTFSPLTINYFYDKLI